MSDILTATREELTVAEEVVGTDKGPNPTLPHGLAAEERIIRHTVTARKIQGGTRSPKGSETKAIEVYYLTIGQNLSFMSKVSDFHCIS